MILDSLIEDDVPVLYDLLSQVEPHTDDEHRVFNEVMDELEGFLPSIDDHPYRMY